MDQFYTSGKMFTQQPLDFMAPFPMAHGTMVPNQMDTGERYPLPPLPPGSIIISDEIIDMDQEDQRNSSQYGNDRQRRYSQSQYGYGDQHASIYEQRRYCPKAKSSKYQSKNSQYESSRQHFDQNSTRLGYPQAYKKYYKKERPNEPVEKNVQKSNSTGSIRRERTLLEGPAPKQRLYSSDEVKSMKNRSPLVSKKGDSSKQREMIIPWRMDNDESDADKYTKAIATQYASENLKVPMTVRMHALKDSDHSFMKRRAVRLTDNLMCIPGVERIIEKRFYVRKEKKQKAVDPSPKLDNTTNVPYPKQVVNENGANSLGGILSEIRNLRDDVAQLKVNQAELMSETRSIRGSEYNKFIGNPPSLISNGLAHNNMFTSNEAGHRLADAEYVNVKNSFLQPEHQQPLELKVIQVPSTQRDQSFAPPHPSPRVIRVQLPYGAEHQTQHINAGTNMIRPPVPNVARMQNSAYTTRGPISLQQSNVSQPNRLSVGGPQARAATGDYSNNDNYEMLIRQAYGIENDPVQSSCPDMANEQDFNQTTRSLLMMQDGYSSYPVENIDEPNCFHYLPNSQYLESNLPHFPATTHDANALYYLENSMETNNNFSGDPGNTFNHEIDYPQPSIVDEVVSQYYAENPNMKDNVRLIESNNPGEQGNQKWASANSTGEENDSLKQLKC